jgi:succinoglycan biosynthesis protein ExoM
MRENVEVETHLYRNDQYEFLRGPVFQNLLCAVKVSRGYVLGSLRSAAEGSGLCGFEEVKPRQVAPGFAPKRTGPPGGNPPHIAVCICTYKRPLPLLRLLEELSRQETQGLFTYSVSIVDNDQAGSASSIVAAFAATSKMQIRYMQEPARGIARARNKVVTESEGDYLALIDDDELPARDWLLSALLDCYRFNADGILGPVHSVYDGQPPAWLEKCELFRRAIHPGGEPVKWRDSRTGNVLIKHGVVLGEEAPFRVEIRAGEDQDFFDRKINAGYSFVWSDRAIVSEVIPPARQKRSYIVRKAMLQGACESSLAGAVNMRSLLTSAIAVPIYLLIMPFSLLFGGHRFTTILVKLFYHLGKLLMAAGINPIREEYVSD